VVSLRKATASFNHCAFKRSLASSVGEAYVYNYFSSTRLENCIFDEIEGRHVVRQRGRTSRVYSDKDLNVYNEDIHKIIMPLQLSNAPEDFFLSGSTLTARHEVRSSLAFVLPMSRRNKLGSMYGFTCKQGAHG
jgi:hypothetical protein